MIQTNEVQQLLRHIHLRFEQKFRDYRMAFRHFDMNFDGTIEFEEFVQGMEFCGIAMSLSEYKKVFDLINYDNADFINFQKFCLINVDKSNNIFRLIEETKKINKVQNDIKQDKEDEEYYNNRSKALQNVAIGINQKPPLNVNRQGHTAISHKINHRHKLI